MKGQGMVGTRGALASGATGVESGSSLDDALANVAGTGGAPSRSLAEEAEPTAALVQHEQVRQAAPADADARWDWGGTTYLSNDDSMSLASAQRLLWAVKNGHGITTSQVRPHELLNYFSFDTAPVAEGQLFSVLASAEQTGPDTLSVALAVKGATPPRRPLDLTVVIDRSGSMSAEGRMEYLKRGLTVMSGNLQRGDRVDLVLFDHEVCTPLEDYVVGRDDPALLTRAIQDLSPRGSTNLDLGLHEGYRLALARTDEADASQRNQRMMVVTDAFLNTGDVDHDTVSEIGKAYEDHGIRLTGVGVGRDFNDEVLDKLTEKGKGAYVYLGSEAVVDRVFGVGFDSLTQTIAHNVRFALSLPPSLAVERFYGEESSTNPDDVQPINYYAGTSQLFLQDLRMKKGGSKGRVKDGDTLTLTISYEDASSGQAGEWAYKVSVGQMLKADAHNLRKARALMAWTDLLLERAMGGSACGPALGVYAQRAALVGQDAEIAYVNDLVNQQCGVQIPMDLQTVAYKVKLDSDMPIAEVALQCAAYQEQESLTAGVSAVTFQVPPGPCTLTLQGQVPMSTEVEVPATGGDLRCMVRGGRLDCS